MKSAQKWSVRWILVKVSVGKQNETKQNKEINNLRRVRPTVPDIRVEFGWELGGSWVGDGGCRRKMEHLIFALPLER